MNRKSWIGPLLVLLGVYLLFFRKEALSAGTLIGHFWPTIFIIPLGLFFHWMYFSMTGRRGAGLLIPGGVLFTIGLVCQLSVMFDSWQYLWPGFIAAPAIGLFEFYWFTDRNKWLLIPINILGGLSLLFFVVFSLGALYNKVIFGQPVLAIALIAIGIGLMLGIKKSR
jgi:hypothetical protein